jgi:hypothetical protein
MGQGAPLRVAADDCNSAPDKVGTALNRFVIARTKD